LESDVLKEPNLLVVSFEAIIKFERVLIILGNHLDCEILKRILIITKKINNEPIVFNRAK